MQYLVSVIDDAAGLATPDEMAAIGAFNDRLRAEGHWVFAGGLASPDSATVIDNPGGEARLADGVPPNPGAWLTTTANRKAIDRIRRENKRDDKQKEAQMVYDDDPPEPSGAIDDERLRLVFTCCHPALALEARVALTLRMVGGLTVPEIAHAFLVQETAMGRRITRAKEKIKAAKVPYRMPLREDLPARVTGVLAVLYLIFNEGYLASDPEKEAVRADLTAEAIRLTRLVQALMPADGDVARLLALMLLTEARRAARVSASGELG